MSSRDVEFVFEPEPGGGYHAYAPELPRLHTQGDSLDEAMTSAEEALALLPHRLAPLAAVPPRC